MNYTKGREGWNTQLMGHDDYSDKEYEWEISYDTEDGLTYPIAHVVEKVDNGTAEANAQLIASAPVLCEALLAVYKDIELQNVEGGSDELNQIVSKALAKADGK